ncbi:MAG: zf-HC2 domain-containing protein [Candidatus Omnitrophota bacterium]
MEDKVVFGCEEIRKRLKPFLEDLLAEDEYQAYITHLDTCSKCKEHVGRFGSLSNQLWELGDIKVPADFLSTVRFNMSEPAPEESQTPAEKKRNNLFAVIVILALISAGAAAGMMYFKKDKPPVMVTRTIQEKKALSPSDSESKALLNELQSIAVSLGASDKKAKSREAATETTVEKTAEAAADADEGAADDGAPPEAKGAKAPQKPKPLHWHFQYMDKFKDDGLKKDIQAMDAKLQQALEAKEKLAAEMAVLKQKAETEFGKQYTKKEQATKAGVAMQAADDLRKKTEESKSLLSEINFLKEGKQDAEYMSRQISEDRRRKGLERKGKVMDALAALNIRFEYQNHGVVAFSTTAEKAKDALQKILSVSPSALNDFTSAVNVLSETDQRVSIYLSGDADNDLHWHAKSGGSAKRSDLFNAVRELGGSVEYESSNMAVFSVPKAELDDLRVRMQAMRIALTEFGGSTSKDGVLSSGPVTVSVYFTS